MTRHPSNAKMAALAVIRTLRSSGHIALLAGGCVRDKLLDRTPKDFDVATDANPRQVLRLFPRARRVGAKFGVVLVRKHGHDVEVATFRADGDYSDGRHPDAVRFGTQLEDALRRDFTINGMFFEPLEDRIFDYVNGRADLSARLIRTIGDPERRFAEDHLRMLRAVRFAAHLGFQIEQETKTAIQHLAVHLREISPERIWLELEQILTAPTRVRGWSLLIETGLRSYLEDHWKPHAAHDGIVQRRLGAMGNVVISAPLALGAVWGSYKSAEIERFSVGLRLSNRLAGAVIWLVDSLRLLRNCGSLELADLKTLMAGENWSDLLELLRIDLVATGFSPQRYLEIRDWAEAIPSSGLTPAPLLDGNDLQQLGIAAGPNLGKMLNRLYRAQLNGVIRTKRQARALVLRTMSPNN